MKKINIKCLQGICTASLILLPFFGFAQKNEKREFRMKDIQPIIIDEKVNGYTVFLQDDEVTKKDKNYFLEFYDIEGNLTSSQTIVRGGFYYLLECSFNGELLCFKFFNLNTKELVLEFFDTDGKLQYSDVMELTKGEKRIVSSSAMGYFPWQPTLIADNGKGFVNHRVTREKKEVYFTTKYYTNQITVGWEINSKEQKPASVYDYPFSIQGDLLYTRLSENYGIYDVGLRISVAKTAKELTTIMFKSSQHNKRVTNIQNTAEGNVFVLGYLLGSDGKNESVNGLFKYELNESGQQISYAEYNFLEQEMDNDFIYFHNFLVYKDDNIIAIGESISLLSASTFTNNEKKGPRIKIGDIKIFKFNKDFKKIDYYSLEKTDRKVLLPYGSEMVGMLALSDIAKEAEYLEFVYADIQPFGANIYYSNKEKKEGERNLLLCAKLKYDGKTNKISKIDLGPKAKRFKIMPSTNGNVVISEYLKKEKKLVFYDQQFD